MGADRLQLAASDEGDERVIALTGELDAATVPVLQSALDANQAHDGVLVLDLEGLDFVDSSGLGAIVECHRTRTEGGGTLALRSLSDRVATVLRYAGLDGHLTIRGAA